MTLVHSPYLQPARRVTARSHGDTSPEPRVDYAIFRRLTTWVLALLVGLTLADVRAASSTPGSPTDAAASSAQPGAAPRVEFTTTLGSFTVELFPDKAPVTVTNILEYVDARYYDGVIFHRVIPGFVAQTGGFDTEFQRKATRPPITNEADNGLQNKRGTLSMARTMDPDSATSQFFISLVDNPNLDPSPSNPGYAVFGKVISGMEVVDAMALQPQGKHRGMFVNAPDKAIVIERARRVDDPVPAGSAKAASSAVSAGTSGNPAE